MKKLKVALLIKNKPAPKARSARNVGYWSYAVDEFKWTHFWQGKRGFSWDTRDYQKAGFDLVFHEDAGNWGVYQPEMRFNGEYKGRGAIPVVYFSVDSTLTDQHFRERLEQGKQADLVLLDHDRPERFAGCRVVRQWNYCVNDRAAKDYDLEKTVDVAFHCSGGAPGRESRAEVRNLLHEWASEWEYIYRSGVVRGSFGDYARAMNQAKIVVNQPRTPINRPHRIFDAMACRACLVTKPIPQVEGDMIVSGQHYIEAADNRDLLCRLKALLDTKSWRGIADAGHTLVMEKHTWAVRAKQLREILHEELGL